MRAHLDDDFWCDGFCNLRRACVVMLATLVLLVSSCTIRSAYGQYRDPRWAPYAIARVTSHGGSGTIIATGPGRSLVLSAAHMFEGSDQRKALRVDTPSSRPGPPQRSSPRVLAVDHRTDLALIELSVGPLEYVCPVAPSGHRPGARLLSVGYDRLELPPQMRPASILETQGPTTYTRELPWHGRSGGALIDVERGWHVGVVSAYSGNGSRRDNGRLDVIPGRMGIYSSHAAVLAFLRRNGYEPDGSGMLTAAPQIRQPYQQPYQPYLPSLAPQARRGSPLLCPT